MTRDGGSHKKPWYVKWRVRWKSCHMGEKDYGDRRKCKMNRKQIKMDWWVVLTFLKTTFSLLSVAAEFTRNRFLLALSPRRLWGSPGHILCLTEERDVAEPPAGCHCHAPGSSRVLGGRNTQKEAELRPSAPSPQSCPTTWQWSEGTWSQTDLCSNPSYTIQ